MRRLQSGPRVLRLCRSREIQRTRLPSLGKSLGTGMREFKDSISGDDKQDEETDASGRPALTQAQADAPAAAPQAPEAANSASEQRG